MQKNNNLILETFGEILIKETFDASLERLHNIIEGNVKAPKLLSLHQEIQNANKEVFNIFTVLKILNL